MYDLKEYWNPYLKLLTSDKRALMWVAQKIISKDFLPKTELKNSIDAIKTVEKYCQFLDSMVLMQKDFNPVEEMEELLKDYEDIAIEESDLSWISEKNIQQLFWSWVHIHLNPINEKYYKEVNPLSKESVYSAEEIYPLLITKFDSFETTKQCKRDYIKNMKHCYHKFLVSKPDIGWLTDKANDDCIWVWGYLTDKLKELNFLKPLSNEDLFHSIITIIANWDFLHQNADALNKNFTSSLEPILSKPQEKTLTKEELISKLTNAYKQKKIRKNSQSFNLLSKSNHKRLLDYMNENGLSEKKALNEIVKAMLD